MDDFDLKILDILQMNCRATADAIAQQVALSPAAVHKRLRKLRRNGHISAEVAILDPVKFGYPMRVIVEVTLERESLHELDAFKAEMRSSPNVQQCYYTTGDADFILHLLVRDIAEYERFTHAHFFENKIIRRFQSNIVMDVVKVGQSVPLC